MWSDRFHYFNIRKDDLLSEEFDTPSLRTFIAQIPSLEQVSDYQFKNKAPFPFTRISLINAPSPNGWSEKDRDSIRTNLLPVVCEKGDELNSQKIIAVLIQIASFLKWELIEEETDEGIENHQVWAPSQNLSEPD